MLKNCAFWVLLLQLYKKIFCNFIENVPEYIDPSGNFVFFVAQTSNINFSVNRPLHLGIYKQTL